MAMLRKVRERLNQAIQRKKKVKSLKGVPKKEFLGAQETVIKKIEPYTSEVPKSLREELKDLPFQYGQDKIVLQVRDPWWIHAYWELNSFSIDRLRNQLADEFYRAKRILRVYDVSFIVFNGANAHRFFDIEVSDHVNNWYIDTAGPGRSWCVDLGLHFSDGRFITIVRSNTVQTPIEGPSWISDEEWMIPEDMFARLYGMGVGFGSSPVKPKRLWEKRLQQQLASGALFSISSPAVRLKEKGFWLVVNTELIVYGATVPNAKVFLQGRPIALRPDGTFSLRFTLPDGKQVIPVKAVSSDNQEERTITPIVTKETK